MVVPWLVLAQSFGIALAVIISALLLARAQRQPPDFVGRVKADAYLAMLRAMLALLAGLGLLRVEAMSGDSSYRDPVRWVGVGLILLGSVAFIARALLYVRRIKPELEQIQEPVVKAQSVEGSVPGSSSHRASLE